MQITAAIPVNNFFDHWHKEIAIKRYGDNMPILSLTNTVDVYRYSNVTLKHLPLKIFEDTILYSKQKLCYHVIEIEDFTMQKILMR